MHLQAFLRGYEKPSLARQAAKKSCPGGTQTLGRARIGVQRWVFLKTSRNKGTRVVYILLETGVWRLKGHIDLPFLGRNGKDSFVMISWSEVIGSATNNSF